MLRYLTSWVRNFAASLEMSCKDAEQVHSRCCDGAAEPGWGLGLWVHHLYCKGCRVYARQVNLMRRAAKGLRERSPAVPPPAEQAMPSDVADRLRERIDPG